MNLPLFYNNCAKQTTRAFKGVASFPSLDTNTESETENENEESAPTVVKPTMELGVETALIWFDEFDTYEDHWTDFNVGQMAPGFQITAETWFPIPNPLVTVAGGKMTLASRPCNSAPAGTEKCGSEISTRTGFNNFVHGHLEVSVQFSANMDRSSGFWLLGALGPGDDQWPRNGEIDLVLFQNTSALSLNRNPYGGLRWFGANCTNNICRMNFPSDLDINYRFQPHIWSITRTRDLLEIFVDAQLFFRVTRAELMELGGNFDVIFNGPMSFRTRNQSGLDSTAPEDLQSMTYDYIRAWRFVDLE